MLNCLVVVLFDVAAATVNVEVVSVHTASAPVTAPVVELIEAPDGKLPD